MQATLHLKMIALEKPPQYIGWDGSRGETRASCICGRLVSDRRLEGRSRMRREPHVRFREGGGVKFPSATRPIRRQPYRREALDCFASDQKRKERCVWMTTKS